MFRPDLFVGKAMLVTGGGTGLGKAMARRFAELGADVTILGRRKEVLETAAAELGAAAGRPLRTVACDIRDPNAVDAAFDSAFAARPPDVLVNNAAANFIARTETLSHRAADAVLATVLHGTFYCTLAAGKRWLAAGRRATVLSIVSPNAETGSPYVVPSAMGKAGILAMTRSLAVEWGGRGIRFVAIAPGSFPTPGAWRRVVPREDLARRFETNNPLGRPGQQEELADLAAYLVSERASYLNGECVTIDGGRWLKGAAGFSFLEELSEPEWAALRPASSREQVRK